MCAPKVYNFQLLTPVLKRLFNFSVTSPDSRISLSWKENRSKLQRLSKVFANMNGESRT